MGVQDFKSQKRITDSTEVERINKLPFVKRENIPDIDNTEKYNWVQVGSTKYGRCMYCTKTHIRRGQTMGEFYGTGIVD